MNLDTGFSITRRNSEDLTRDHCIPPDSGFKEETCRKREPGTLAAVDWWQTLQVYATRVVDTGTHIHGSELMVVSVGHGV